MHRAALVGDRLKDSAIYQSDSMPTHDWDTLRDDVNVIFDNYLFLMQDKIIIDLNKALKVKSLIYIQY